MKSGGTGNTQIFAVVFLVCTFLFSNVHGQDACWNLENHFSIQCNANPALSWDFLPPIQTQLEDTEAVVKSLRGTLCTAALQISKGFALAHRVGGTLRSSAFPAIDIEVLASQAIDEPAGPIDPYWQYYLDCDRWDVVFIDQFIPLDVPVSEPVEPNPFRIAKSIANTWHNAKTRIQQTEFQIFESFDRIAGLEITLASWRSSHSAIPKTENAEIAVAQTTLNFAKQVFQQHPMISSFSKVKSQIDRRVKEVFRVWSDTRAGLLWISSEWMQAVRVN